MNKIDILIIGEGTYPYIRGGVSAWIHQIVTEMKEFNFGIVFLGSKRKDYGEKQYQFPSNIKFYKEIFLFDKEDLPDVKKITLNKKFYSKIENIHNYFHESLNLSEVLDKFFDLIENFPLNYFLYSDDSWEYIVNSYKKDFKYEPFLDFFWSVRNMHIPLWNMFDELDSIADVKIIHTPSTGYAGFLGGLLKAKKNIPLILTEHGIYVRERKIDLLTSDLFEVKTGVNVGYEETSESLKNLWNNFFIKIGKFSYDMSDKILSLYPAAKKVQILYGAQKEKCQVIPNGVNVDKLKKCISAREKKENIIGLIGRVVSIKDIKTFIKSIKLVSMKISDIQGWVVGPTDEDPEYFEECKNLVEILNLNNNIKFLGFQNVMDIFPKISINTLTSISEGMPLSILEGFAAGVPAVCTNVGACEDLICGGLNKEDKEIGYAGLIARVANPQDLSKKYIELLNNKNLWDNCQKNALKRVNKFYTQEIFIQNYKNIYKKYL